MSVLSEVDTRGRTTTAGAAAAAVTMTPEEDPATRNFEMRSKASMLQLLRVTQMLPRGLFFDIVAAMTQVVWSKRKVQIQNNVVNCNRSFVRKGYFSTLRRENHV